MAANSVSSGNTGSSHVDIGSSTGTTLYTNGNLLLDRLGAEQLDALRDNLGVVAIGSGDLLYSGSADDDLDYVYFPIDGVTSMLATMANGDVVEAGTVGREGMVGAQCAFGSARMAERWIGQVPGTTARMSLTDYRRHFRSDPQFAEIIGRYVQSYMAFLAQSVACNSLHLLIQRCARWLLLTHDRANRDTFGLTHEFLAMMLGVRRPGVSVAAASLQSSGIISYVRGTVTIRNRAALEASACECYRTTTTEYARLFAEPATFQDLPVSDDPLARRSDTNH